MAGGEVTQLGHSAPDTDTDISQLAAGDTIGDSQITDTQTGDSGLGDSQAKTPGHRSRSLRPSRSPRKSPRSPRRRSRSPRRHRSPPRRSRSRSQSYRRSRSPHPSHHRPRYSPRRRQRSRSTSSVSENLIFLYCVNVFSIGSQHTSVHVIFDKSLGNL